MGAASFSYQICQGGEYMIVVDLNAIDYEVTGGVGGETGSGSPHSPTINLHVLIIAQPR